MSPNDDPGRVDLSTTLTRTLESAEVPRADLASVIRRGRSRRQHRRTLVAGVMVAVAAIVVLVLVLPWGGAARDRAPQPVGRPDVSHGLRAYADPGAGLHLAGTTIRERDVPDLDTAAATTRSGIVYFKGSHVMLLRPNGTTVTLATFKHQPPEGWQPRAVADSVQDRVAWVEPGSTDESPGPGPEVSMYIEYYDVSARKMIGNSNIMCSRACARSVRVAAVDRGIIYLNTATGAVAVPAGGPEVSTSGGSLASSTKVVDVRSGVILYGGARPEFRANPLLSYGFRGHRFVKAPSDARLTFDGKYVLSWSSKLRSTNDGPAIQLPVDGNFFAFDTDGSVLVATSSDSGGYRIYDCVIGAPRCDPVGKVTAASGDPEFVGADQ